MRSLLLCKEAVMFRKNYAITDSGDCECMNDSWFITSAREVLFLPVSVHLPAHLSVNSIT